MAIGGRLREFRKAQGLTLEQVETATSLSQPYLSKIERDRTLPRPDTFKAIAEAVGLSDEVSSELLEELLFERDCAELERCGLDRDVAELAVALSRLDPQAREPAIDRARSELPTQPEMRR